MAADQKEYLRHFLSAESSLRGYILAHVRDFSVADDLLQQTALVLWEKFAQYDPARPFLAWALGVARFEILNASRKTPPRSLLEGDLDSLIVGEYLRLDSELPRRRQLLRTCLQKLPAPMSDAVRLRYDDGLRVDHIATKLGKSLGAVKVLLHRARAALQDCVRMKVST